MWKDTELMNYNKQIETLTDMVAASSRLSIGLAGVLYATLPPKDWYKVEVLLEAHNDAMDGLVIFKGEEE